MIAAIIITCLTILGITAGCIWEIERSAMRDFEIEKLKIEKGYHDDE